MAQEIVEVNDVDIAPLFTWSGKFNILIGDGKRKSTVFLRLPGDADINRSRVAALRAGAELRKKLKDTNSDERLAFIKDIDEVDTETLIAVILVFSMRDLAEKARPKLKTKLPKKPRSDAKTEAHEKYQQEIDAYPQKRQAEMKELVEKEVEAMKLVLEKEDKSLLYSKYVAAMVDELCEQEHVRVFKNWCCYLGAFKDEEMTQHFFKDYNEFDNLPPQLKQDFLLEYNKLELKGDELKKLQQVTQ